MSFRGSVKKIVPKDLFKSIEPTGHLAEAILLQTAHGFPAHDLKVIGVTGTNGKTTTCFMIHRMLHEAGYKVGLMTTVAYGAGMDITPQIEHMTTVSVPIFARRVKAMKAAGIEWLVLETTSHALAQHRVWGIPYTVAVMTNITHEHLDYHGTFERYVEAKRRLFTQTDHNHQGLRFGVVNADDPSAAKFQRSITNSVSYGIGHGDLQAKEIDLQPDGVSYKAKLNNITYNIHCHIPGSFNVYNSLATVAVGQKLGLTKEQIEHGIDALTGVEGRMTRVNEGQDFNVVVDYAHTPDSFEKLFKDLRPVVKGKMIVLFGSAGGKRDRLKRPIQGQLAGKYADEVILTEEDDRDTDSQLILDEIAAGAVKAGKIQDQDLFMVHDRSEAIDFALSRAKSKEDMVLLLGKGHEKTIERADGEHPWNEINIAKEAINKLLKK